MRGERIKHTNNLGFNEIESERSARRAKSTILCQAEGSVRATAEDAAKTDIQERKDQFLRTVERLLKPSGKKETCYRRRKEKRTGMLTRRNGQEPLRVAEKPFPGWVA